MAGSVPAVGQGGEPWSWDIRRGTVPEWTVPGSAGFSLVYAEGPGLKASLGKLPLHRD